MTRLSPEHETEIRAEHAVSPLATTLGYSGAKVTRMALAIRLLLSELDAVRAEREQMRAAGREACDIAGTLNDILMDDRNMTAAERACDADEVSLARLRGVLDGEPR